ncbi:dihydrodipicolinate synthase family protein [Saccharothrix sp. CB00851]|uniref:dihydrodipicolinate synthase family protein n=2 Tax=Saccharothrix TaxID=2071 RepID=UPI00093AA730|nr:dihydrodipicolinate synthase family protein [Saccharothrix sp. CB00851]OKI31351.1 4-hydroxy-tetrahydrodipicolinate synthase [Saccharothrix sp. CB00851]
MTLTGLYVPLITPFDRSGAVAFDALDALANQALDDGARGLVALGTTAEPSSLTPAEQQAVLDVAARVCRARHAPLVVGANTSANLQNLRNHAEVTAALTVVPPFVRPGEDGAVAYLTRLATESPVPLIVYDIPYRTGQYLSAAALRRLADVPGIVGLKYAAGGINADTVDLFADLPDLAILGGDDAFISPLLALGAHGGILASAHIATAEFVRLIDAWHAGDVTVARALGGRIGRLSAALFAEPNPTVIKAVLHAQGRIPTPDVRLPLLPAHPDSTSAALTAAELLLAAPRA